MNSISDFLSSEMRADLEQPARTACRTVLGLQSGERVLIITNPEPDVFAIAAAFHQAAAQEGAVPVFLVQPVKQQLEEGEEAVFGAIGSEPDVVLSLTRFKMGKDRRGIVNPYPRKQESSPEEKTYDNLFHYLLFGKRSLRGAWSPGITRDIFRRTVDIDYTELRRKAAAVQQLLDTAVAARITSEAGTDISLGLRGRRAILDNGDFTRPGTGGNLPAGEAFISPALKTAEGRIVFDGSITTLRGDLMIDSPVAVEVSGGYVKKVFSAGGMPNEAAEILQETLDRSAENARRCEAEGKLAEGQGAVYARNAGSIGELGIGLNPAARITGSMLEDEKAARTCHLALGSNYDEDAPALTHLDGLVREPTIELEMPDRSRKEILIRGDLHLPDGEG